MINSTIFHSIKLPFGAELDDKFLNDFTIESDVHAHNFVRSFPYQEIAHNSKRPITYCSV